MPPPDPDDAPDDDANTAPGADFDAEEARCLRCGRCCHEKIRVGRDVIITDVPCPFLDTVRKTCRVYAERFARQPHCSTARRSAAAGGMPGDCPYARDVENYHAPLMLADHPEYWPLVAEYFPGRSAIAAAWQRSGAPTAYSSPPTSRAPRHDEHVPARRRRRPPSAPDDDNRD